MRPDWRDMFDNDDNELSDDTDNDNLTRDTEGQFEVPSDQPSEVIDGNPLEVEEETIREERFSVPPIPGADQDPALADEELAADEEVEGWDNPKKEVDDYGFHEE